MNPHDPWDPDDSEPGGGFVQVPAFESGGRVERTGIALVHEGEYIMPAPGSEALIGAGTPAGGQIIHYHFPVEIEIIGELGESQIRRVADQLYRELNDAIDSKI